MTTSDFWTTVKPLLEAKLDPANVKPPAPGRFGDYIEGWHAIAEANRIFGHGGWSYRVDSLTLLDRDKVMVFDKWKKQDVEQWRACYECVVTVTVGNVSRQDVGYGQGQAKVPNIGDALESAGKEAVTDALKRAMRTFGYPLGLALYDKSKAHVGVDATPHDPETGEVRGNGHDHGEAIRQSWSDIVLDDAGLTMQSEPNQKALAYSAQMIKDIGTYKSQKGLNAYLAAMNKISAGIGKFPSIYRTVEDAITRQEAWIKGGCREEDAEYSGLYPDGQPG